jgi:5-methylcytosine-specific restriction endonuclease McrA
LDSILVAGSGYQSSKLKKRLIKLGLKDNRCELCGWAASAQDGRVPVELDHVNADRTDHRIEDLRILCPNCHSLQPTHRGLNSRKKG